MTSLFTFSPYWGERLIVEGPGGSFGLEHPLGVPSVVLPPEEEWREKGPPWARGLWPELHSELDEWCRKSDCALRVEEGALVVHGD